MSKPRPITPKSYGLVLDLGGAPRQPHVLPGIRHQFRPDVPLPVGEGTAIALEEAQKWADDAGIPLRLVPMTDADRKSASERHSADLTDLRKQLPAIAAETPDHAITSAVLDSLVEVAKPNPNDPKES